MKTLKVSLAIGRHVKRDGFACQDEGQQEKPLGSQIAKVNVVRELQSPSFHFGDCRCFPGTVRLTCPGGRCQGKPYQGRCARRSQSASGDASQAAPILWADADAVHLG